jgi:hypothetical protein
MLLAICMIAVFSPQAKAGWIDDGYTANPLTFGCNPSGSCGKYQIIAPSPNQPIYIHPLTSQSFKPGESASAFIDPPDWVYPNNQGLVLRIVFYGSVLGKDWQGQVCAPGCNHVYKTNDNAVMDLPLANAGTGARILIKQIGTTTQSGSAVTPIHLRAATYWYVVDNQPPSVGFTINGKGLENRMYNAADGQDDQLPVTVSASDNTDINPASLVVNGAPMAFSPDDGSVTVNVGNGAHPLSVHICDVAGNCSDAAPVITYDSGTPAVTLLSTGEPGAPFPVFTTQSPVFVVRATDPLVGGSASGIKTGKLNIDGQIVDSTSILSGDNLTIQPVNPIEEGIHTCGAQAIDVAGNMGEDPNANQCAVDISPPTADAVTPEPGKKYPASGAPTTLTANAADKVGIRSVSMLFDGSVTVELEQPDQTEPPQTLSSTGTVDGLQCSGPHRASYTVTDWGHHSFTKDWSWTVAGKLVGACKRIACNHAKAWVKNLTKSASPLRSELRKQKHLLKLAIHQSQRGPKAKRPLARAKIPGLRTQVAALNAQIKKANKDLRTARSLRSHVC